MKFYHQVSTSMYVPLNVAASSLANGVIPQTSVRINCCQNSDLQIGREQRQCIYVTNLLVRVDRSHSSSCRHRDGGEEAIAT